MMIHNVKVLATGKINFPCSLMPRMLDHHHESTRKSYEARIGFIRNKKKSQEGGEGALRASRKSTSAVDMKPTEKYAVKLSGMKKVPENYVFPPEQRAGENDLHPFISQVPVIDMASDRATLAHQIMQASQELGAFQVINHGVPRRLLDDARDVFKELFALPEEDKLRLRPGHGDPRCILSPSSLYYDTEQIHLWREALKQKCTPLEECMPHWPHKPARYREVVTEYVAKVNEVGSRILEVMCEELGLKPGYFSGDLARDLDLNLNHYPPSPDPSLTIGAPRHSDRSVLTILLQDHVAGLQIAKDGKWIGVEPIPDALVFAVGYILHMVTNGKLINGDHRVLTNANETRESAALFLCPTQDCLIEPAKDLIDAENNPPLFKCVPYHEFLAAYNTRRESKYFDEILQTFRIKA